MTIKLPIYAAKAETYIKVEAPRDLVKKIVTMPGLPNYPYGDYVAIYLDDVIHTLRNDAHPQNESDLLMGIVNLVRAEGVYREAGVKLDFEAL